MSNFVIGNRVRVEFDGTILSFTSHGTVLVQREDGRQHWMHPNHLTKLHDPLPDKKGAIVLITDVGRSFHRLGLFWYEPGVIGPVGNFIVQRLADEYGFTVLYPGDE